MYDAKTCTYSRVGELALEVDVYLPNEERKCSAVLVFYHGGYMVSGNKRSMLLPWLKAGCRKRNWLLLSADYRLLPECSGMDIIEDAKKLNLWIKGSMNKELGIHANTDKIILCGASGGGYAVVCASNIIQVAATMLIYPCCDLSSPIYHSTTLPTLTEEQTRPVIEEMKARKKQYVSQFEPVASAVDQASHRRSVYIKVLLANNLYPDFISDIEGLSKTIRDDGEEVIPEEVRPAFPLTRPLSPSFAPTVIIHGCKDGLISIEESHRLVARLKETGIEYRLIELEDGPHGFGRQRDDVDMSNDDLSLHLRSMLTFVEDHI